MKNVVRFLAVFMFAGLVCHFVPAGWAEEDEEHGGTIIFDEPVKAVVFDHDIHIDMGFGCEDCHEDVFDYETGAAAANGDFTMDALYDGKYCGACHDGDTAFASNSRCTVCHIGVKGYNRMYKVGGGEESHGH